MSAANITDERHVLPRFLPFDRMQNKCELSNAFTSKVTRLEGNSEYNGKVYYWIHKHNLYNAVEVLSSALIHEIHDEHTTAAANYLRNVDRISPYLKELANIFITRKTFDLVSKIKSIFDTSSDEPYRLHIARLRYLTQEYPKNPINWSDLAFYYATVGEDAKAEKSMDLALYLGFANRYIIRSSVRFFVHIGKYDKALGIIYKYPYIMKDPWVMAPEISLSILCEKNSRAARVLTNTLKRYKKDSTDFPIDFSEGASAVGTLELLNGHNKNAFNYAELTAIRATENSIAQAEWVARMLGKPIQRHAICDSELYEADAYRAFKDGNFKKALSHVEKWSAYQPFSATPAMTGTYIASAGMGDYNKAIDIAKSGLKASPNSFTLLNNISFSLASLDQADEGFEYFKKIKFKELDEENSATYLATAGLYAFRTGDYVLGRQYYHEAVKVFEKKKGLKLSMCLLYWLREEKLIGSDQQNKLKERIAKQVTKDSPAELKRLYTDVTGILV